MFRDIRLLFSTEPGLDGFTVLLLSLFVVQWVRHLGTCSSLVIMLSCHFCSGLGQSLIKSICASKSFFLGGAGLSKSMPPDTGLAGVVTGAAGLFSFSAGLGVTVTVAVVMVFGFFGVLVVSFSFEAGLTSSRGPCVDGFLSKGLSIDLQSPGASDFESLLAEFGVCGDVLASLLSLPGVTTPGCFVNCIGCEGCVDCIDCLGVAGCVGRKVSLGCAGCEDCAG